jgi:protocatechuate 3,4-dioxygenase, beta subunit
MPQPVLPPLPPAHPGAATPGRRQALTRLASLPWLGLLPAGLARATNAAPLRLTPAQTEGPFYPVRLPADTDFDLLRQGGRSYRSANVAWLSGQVTDVQARPLAGCTVEIWQCDEAGHYHHPGDGDRADPDFQGFGRVVTDAQGAFRFRTLRPAPYSGRTPHIHLKLRQGPRELLTTQLYVAGDAGNARDGLWRRLSAPDQAALTLPFLPGPEGLQAQCHLVVPAVQA